MMSTPWSLFPPFIVNSTPVFSGWQLSSVVFGIISRGNNKKLTVSFFLSPSATKYLHVLVCLIYHKKSFVYGLTSPSHGRCDLMCRLKLFLKKASLLSQLLFDRSGNNNEKQAIVIA